MNKPISIVFDNDRVMTQAEMAEFLQITKSAQEKLERRLIEKLRAEFAARGVGVDDTDTLLAVLRGF